MTAPGPGPKARRGPAHAALPDGPTCRAICGAIRAPTASGGRDPRGSTTDGSVPDTSTFDALLARTAARLQLACRPMPATAFDTLVHEVVLDVARFALGWTEA